VNKCLGEHELTERVFGFVRELSDLAYRLRRALTVAESSEKDCFDTEKLMIEG
jgi:hypothetical protein